MLIIINKVFLRIIFYLHIIKLVLQSAEKEKKLRRLNNSNFDDCNAQTAIKERYLIVKRLKI